MSVSILECLQNAHINLVINGNTQVGQILGREQLTNAVRLLEKGYNLQDEVEPLIEIYGDAESVPDKAL